MQITLTSRRGSPIQKNRINEVTAHANVISGESTFRKSGEIVHAPFFDIEDEYFVKTDLWLISSVAITLMDFFFGVAGNVDRGGRSVVEFRADFQRTIVGLGSENEKLRAEIIASERYKAAMLKITQRKEAASDEAQRTDAETERTSDARGR